jgi:hypothetical protein
MSYRSLSHRSGETCRIAFWKRSTSAAACVEKQPICYICVACRRVYTHFHLESQLNSDTEFRVYSSLQQQPD